MLAKDVAKTLGVLGPATALTNEPHFGVGVRVTAQRRDQRSGVVDRRADPVLNRVSSRATRAREKKKGRA